MQQATELRRQIGQQREECGALLELWRELITSVTGFEPTFATLRFWRDRYDFNVVTLGIRQTAMKAHKTQGISEEHLLRYATRCMSNEVHKARNPMQDGVGVCA